MNQFVSVDRMSDGYVVGVRSPTSDGFASNLGVRKRADLPARLRAIGLDEVLVKKVLVEVDSTGTYGEVVAIRCDR